MRRTFLPLVLCFAMLLTGCQSWNVNAFGVPLNRSANYASSATAPARASAPRTMGYHAADPKSAPLSKEEKTGAIVVIGLAIALIVAGALAFS